MFMSVICKELSKKGPKLENKRIFTSISIFWILICDALKPPWPLPSWDGPQRPCHTYWCKYPLMFNVFDRFWTILRFFWQYFATNSSERGRFFCSTFCFIFWPKWLYCNILRRLCSGPSDFLFFAHPYLHDSTQLLHAVYCFFIVLCIK